MFTYKYTVPKTCRISTNDKGFSDTPALGMGPPNLFISSGTSYVADRWQPARFRGKLLPLSSESGLSNKIISRNLKTERKVSCILWQWITIEPALTSKRSQTDWHTPVAKATTTTTYYNYYYYYYYYYYNYLLLLLLLPPATTTTPTTTTTITYY